MNICKIELFPQQIAGTPEATGLLIEEREGRDYIDGKPSDTVSHRKCTIVFPLNSYEKVIVKVTGGKPVITNEEIQQKGGTVKVRLKGLTGKFYRTNSGEYALSASAEGMEVIQ